MAVAHSQASISPTVRYPFSRINASFLCTASNSLPSSASVCTLLLLLNPLRLISSITTAANSCGVSNLSKAATRNSFTSRPPAYGTTPRSAKSFFAQAILYALRRRRRRDPRANRLGSARGAPSCAFSAASNILTPRPRIRLGSPFSYVSIAHQPTDAMPMSSPIL